MLAFENVTKLYRTARGEVRSLHGLDLQVKAGEFVVLRGPSGCGKTTLLLTAGGLLRPTAGRVQLDGRDLYALSPSARNRIRREEIGFVFQMFHLLPYLNVRENILLAAPPPAARQAAKVCGPCPPAGSWSPAGTAPSREAAQGHVELLLHRLGLKAREHHRPPALSTGERQRTAIARALLNRPRLILADEPTGNLDPASATEVFRCLQGFHQSGGTVVLATHGTAADAFADRVCELRQGALALTGSSSAAGSA